MAKDGIQGVVLSRVHYYGGIGEKITDSIHSIGKDDMLLILGG